MVGKEKEGFKDWLINNVRRKFVIGFLIVVPVSVTIWILVWFFGLVDSILGRFIVFLFGRTFPGVGLVLTLLLIYLTGIVGSNVVGRRIIQRGEVLISRIPLVRYLYFFIKKIVDSFSSSSRGNLLRVVLVRFPRDDMTSIGFITNETIDNDGKKRFSVLVPLAPNPISGFLLVIPEERVTLTNIRVDDALRMIVSAGSQLPEELTGWMTSKDREMSALGQKQDSKPVGSGGRDESYSLRETSTR